MAATEIAILGSTTGKEQAEIDRRERIANELVTADVDYLSVDHGPLSVESAVEEAWAGAALLPLVNEHAGDYDAFVVSCFGEPGLTPLRELVEVPVVGTAAPTFHTAAQLATQFSVLTILEETVPMTREQVHALGLTRQVASIRAVDAPVLSVDHESNALVEQMREVGRRAIEEDGAEALIPGCASLSFMQVHQDLTEELGVPFLDPVRIALGTAELWADHGITHSRAAYPEAPREKLDGLFGDGPKLSADD
ncbi:MAG: aspartate/glutamate racemase family protein [Halobacteriales archaeon]|nr:aspartate/glutamate racemase family protein [Halobacteriales archaeon]